MLHLLDTSVCVSLIRGRSASSPLPPTESCVVSVITVAELEVGIHRSARSRDQRLAVDAVLACFTIMPFESSAATDYGEIRADLETKGTLIGPLDLLIAAHARSLGAAVLTGNVSEFKRVKGLKVLAWN
ncbi:MAG TPA: type II toxin-antitoxin system VapC family toxin [Chthoniobacterales bacterium]